MYINCFACFQDTPTPQENLMTQADSELLEDPTHQHKTIATLYFQLQV